MALRFTAKEVREIVSEVSEDPEYFLGLVDTFCSPETKATARRAMAAWGIPETAQPVKYRSSKYRDDN